MGEILNADIIIPIQIDSPDRLKNIKFLIDYYNEFNIIIRENGVDSKIIDLPSNVINFYEKSESNIFHKTKVLNELYKLSKKEIVIILDADVIVPKEQLLEAMKLIMVFGYDAVYPYSFKGGVTMLDNENLDKNNLEKNAIMTIDAGYGYCLVINRDKFIGIGAENEDFFGYAPEDWERHDRVSRLLKTKYLNGKCYHIKHAVVNNHNKQPFFEKNDKLYKEIQKYNNNEYNEYVKNLIHKNNDN